MSNMSVIVVEIDTRNGPTRTAFESSVENQSEQAKQFWKTLILHPHIESSLYSSEILQRTDINPLTVTKISNARKLPPIDKRAEAFQEKVKILNQYDEIKKIQVQLTKMEEIRALKKKQHENFSKIAIPVLKSAFDEDYNPTSVTSLGQKFEVIDIENEYEIENDAHLDQEIVKQIDQGDDDDDNDD